MGSASATSAPVRRSHPRRCSTWRRSPSPSSRPRSCRWRPLRDAGAPVLDLDAPITDWVPEFTLADGRAGEVTARRLLSHSSGLPDVAEYGWHDPQLGDDALSEFAGSLSGRRLQAEPGSAFSYSNAGYELLGLLLSRVTGTTFENAIRQQVLTPLGMRNEHLPAQRGARAPGCLTARGDAIGRARGRLSLHQTPCPQLEPPLQRRRDVSLDGGPLRAGRGGWFRRPWVRLDAGLVDLMWQPVVPVDEPPGNKRGRSAGPWAATAATEP